MTPDFWERCIKAECVVVPVMAYAQYDAEGNEHAQYFQGIRFAALKNDASAVGPDYWFMVDDGHTGPLYETPEAALDSWERNGVAARF